MSSFSFLRPQQHHAGLILEWRCKERIANQSLTVVTHNIDQQRQWLAACEEREDYCHWLLAMRGEPIGLIALNKVDWAAKTTFWSYYIGEDTAIGLGGLVPPFLFNFVFAERPVGGLGFNEILAEVIEGNNAAARVHKLFGSERRPGIDDHTLPDGRRVLRYGLDLGTWSAKTAYANKAAQFPLSPGMQRRLIASG